jgi:hypothetical protein
MDEITGPVATPVMRAHGVLGHRLVAGLVKHFASLADMENYPLRMLVQTGTQLLAVSPPFMVVAPRITRKLVDFGPLLFGQRMGRSTREV